MLAAVHRLEHVDEGEEVPGEWYSLAQLEIACDTTTLLVVDVETGLRGGIVGE